MGDLDIFYLESRKKVRAAKKRPPHTSLPMACLGLEVQVQLVFNRPLSALIKGTDTAYGALRPLRGETVHTSDVTEAGRTRC